ncbi:MAG: BadF/BadG/BcrA/BcrD ATPase family protein [Vulcanimicrobiaceae bacterium]
MNELFAGIDGGQSSTTAVIGDRAGRVLGRGSAGAADEVGQGTGSTKLSDALGGALAAALEAAGLPAGTRLAAIVAGVSGYEGRPVGRVPDLPSSNVDLLHDAPIAHAGAFGGEGGAIVIAGTGSVAYASDGKAPGSTCGGWGYLFGDEGSAFWLVRETIAFLMREQDRGSLAGAEQIADLLQAYGCESLRGLAHAFYGGSLTRAELAGYAERIVAAPACAEIVARGAQALADLAGSVLRAQPHVTRRIALSGGLFKNGAYVRAVTQAIARAGSGIVPFAPRYDAAVGALLLAYARGGLAVREVLAV